MALVSVIIPTYNVEDYIGECLDSICNQTLNDIEIICIDDGSDDSTLDKLNEYASKDDRIKVISQENKGPSSARNAGLDNALGKYIYFMDSDDYLELNALEKLTDIAEENSLDLIIFKLINFDDGSEEKYETRYYNIEALSDLKNTVFSYKDIPDKIFHIAVSPPGKLFKRNLIKDIRFIEGVIFEDNIFFIEALFNSTRLYFYDEYLYNRRVRPGSLMTSKKNFADYIFVSNRLIDITKENGMFDACKASLFDKIIINNYSRFSQSQGESKLEYFDKLKKDFLAKKEEYADDNVFEIIPSRPREIFNSCIESENAREFDLSVKLIDSEILLQRTEDALETKKDQFRNYKEVTKAQLRSLRHDKNQLINNSKRLSAKVNELSYEQKLLVKENKTYKQENRHLTKVNNELMSSTSWKVTKPLRLAGRVVKK